MHVLGELIYWPMLAEATPFQGSCNCMLAQKIAISLLRNGGAICHHPACLGMFFCHSDDKWRHGFIAVTL